MADSKKDTKSNSPVSPIGSTEDQPESPTTAQPLDFDDDQDTAAATPTKMSATEGAPKPAPPPKDENPPAKPPRPLNPREQAEQTLREAFPTIDPGVIRAVLTASGGQLEPAFNALLEMTDPDAAQREPPPPAMPPRPTRQPPAATHQSQLEADEMYARQLAEHYNSPAVQNTPNRYNENLPGSRPGRPGQNPNPDDYHWRSFIDDDLPEIRDNIKKGFFETQKTVNSWITNFKKNFDAEDDDYTTEPARPAQQPVRRSNEYGRRSADYNRYDADPQVIGDDFSKLDLKDGEHPPRTTSRPVANPNLLKHTSDRRKSSPAGGRKVSFQEGPPEEIRDMYSASPKPTNVQTASTAGKSSKWQPLSAVEPSPVTDNDPFSLGDSDDEKEAKPITLKDDEVDKAKVGAEMSTKDTKEVESKT
ncbi:ubiquitin-binding protein cue5 [Neophaeococcomyces mojaviensis]|uniref:Ubiquitin-binding protein cue5 n=1 Tax=Neophaeococcomyces mojaviensis TaxID=3383035 RepID=A0ACC2ZTQ8_9EURO|nr:ubiquitin-binding protein cue5 [Knufia sp. JES_112]